jgi:hypothetical protein
VGKLMALAAAGITIVAAAMFAGIPAASANASYCMLDETALNGSPAWVGSNTSGSLIPFNYGNNCVVEYTRINYHDFSNVGYYEYQATTGPDVGLCIKEDPGINDSGYHPVVSAPCDNSNDATRNEELWTGFSGEVSCYESPDWDMVRSNPTGPYGLYTSHGGGDLMELTS